MANWVDFLSLAATIVVICGVVYSIVYVTRVINDGWTSTKESLKTKGLDISRTGVSVKTSRRFDREDYMDATQRGIVKIVGASSFRKGENTTNGSSPQPSPKMEENPSSPNSPAHNEKRKSNLFRSRK